MAVDDRERETTAREQAKDRIPEYGIGSQAIKISKQGNNSGRPRRRGKAIRMKINNGLEACERFIDCGKNQDGLNRPR